MELENAITESFRDGDVGQSAVEADMYKCAECEKQFNSARSLALHSKSHKSNGGKIGDLFVCQKCGKTAKTRQALERHAAYHEDDRPFPCEKCQQRFKNSDDRGKHYRRLKRDGKFEHACKTCHKHFKSDVFLHKHQVMLGCLSVSSGNDKKEIIKVNETEEILEEVISFEESEVLEDIKHLQCRCKICEEELQSAELLKSHYKLIHNDLKRQVCIQCGQTLSSKDSLNRHYNIFHQEEFPYPCSQCNHKFKIKESLYRHVKFVHTDGGYPCPVCRHVFSQPVNLKKHMAVHSAHKEHICEVCGKGFKWKQGLQKHVLMHNARKSEKLVEGAAMEDSDKFDRENSDSAEDTINEQIFGKSSDFVPCAEVNDIVDSAIQFERHKETVEAKCYDKPDRDKERLSTDTLEDSFHGQQNETLSEVSPVSEIKEPSSVDVDMFNDCHATSSSMFAQVIDLSPTYHSDIDKQKQLTKIMGDDGISESNDAITSEKYNLHGMALSSKLTHDKICQISNGKGLHKTKQILTEDSCSQLVELERTSTTDSVTNRSENYDLSVYQPDLVGMSGENKLAEKQFEMIEMDLDMRSGNPEEVKRFKVTNENCLSKGENDSGLKKTFHDISEVNEKTFHNSSSGSKLLKIFHNNPMKYIQKDLSRHKDNDTSENASRINNKRHIAIIEADELDLTNNHKKQIIEESIDENRKEATDTIAHGHDRKLVLFKPSSLPLLMAPLNAPTSSPTVEGNEDSSDHSEKAEQEHVPSKTEIALLHHHRVTKNPFIIQNRYFTNTNKKVCQKAQCALQTCALDLTKTKQQVSVSNLDVPSKLSIGKFSLIKHMLSLQNEEHFDKALFDNPLYNRPVEIQDFKKIAEMHKISGDVNVEEYDLSAKQNIPIHWLGLSRSKCAINAGTITSDCGNYCSNVKHAGEGEDGVNCTPSNLKDSNIVCKEKLISTQIKTVVKDTSIAQTIPGDSVLKRNRSGTVNDLNDSYMDLDPETGMDFLSSVNDTVEKHHLKHKHSAGKNNSHFTCHESIRDPYISVRQRPYLDSAGLESAMTTCSSALATSCTGQNNSPFLEPQTNNSSASNETDASLYSSVISDLQTDTSSDKFSPKSPLFPRSYTTGTVLPKRSCSSNSETLQSSHESRYTPYKAMKTLLSHNKNVQNNITSRDNSNGPVFRNSIYMSQVNQSSTSNSLISMMNAQNRRDNFGTKYLPNDAVIQSSFPNGLTSSAALFTNRRITNQQGPNTSPVPRSLYMTGPYQDEPACRRQCQTSGHSTTSHGNPLGHCNNTRADPTEHHHRLTHSQMTNFRPFQFESICRGPFHH